MLRVVGPKLEPSLTWLNAVKVLSALGWKLTALERLAAKLLCARGALTGNHGEVAPKPRTSGSLGRIRFC